MTTTPTNDLRDEPPADAVVRLGMDDPLLRYRGVPYRPSDLPSAPRAVSGPMRYRGVAYRRTSLTPGSTPAPGVRRYRGVAY